MLTPGQIITLTIEKPAAGGRMIARANGQVILVSGAIPGERVRARIERVSKSVAFAETVGIEDGSSDRRAEAGDLNCGGMLLGHIDYPRQLEIKRAVIADAFLRIGHLPLPSAPPVAASPEQGYRMRARLHVRAGGIGFFREGTHDLCDVRQTRQLLDGTVDALDRLGATLRSLGAMAVREIELSENVDASERAIALDLAAAVEARVLERVASVEGFSGCVAPGFERGRARVTDTMSIGGNAVSLQRHVLAFFQGNRYLLSRFVEHVLDQVPPGREVLDLYAGVGLFAVPAAAVQQGRVTAVEGDRVAAADLAANVIASALDIVTVHEPVETFVARTAPTTNRVVIVDPPRTGMSRRALDGVLHLKPARLVYVSCDVATLARDARRIVDSGYQLARIDAFDLFPNTPHVETVAVFE